MPINLSSADLANVFLLASASWLAGLVLTTIFGSKLKDSLYAFLMFLGSALTVAAGVLSWSTSFEFSELGFLTFGLASPNCRVDPLCVPFFILLGILGCASALASPSYTGSLTEGDRRNRYWQLTYVFLIGLLQTLLSANAISFLVFWEIMSLSSCALIASDYKRHRAQRAAFGYLTATRTSTALLTAAFLWMHYLSGSWTMSDWHFELRAALPASIMILLGACTKAGVWPMHVWMPLAYPKPPAPTTVLLCGMVGKMAIFLMIRLLLLGRCQDLTVAYILLGLGTISAVWGVLFALMERDLKRMLAFSSVENMGLIALAIGVAVLANCRHLPTVTALATAAAIFHSINHGLTKALLFLAASSVERATRTRDMSTLGGLAKKLPWTMLCFFIGSLSICALPPLNGFASKWLIYETFFRLSFERAELPERAMGLAMVGVLAFVGALSLACFTKAVGIAFLGRPRSAAAAKASEGSGKPDGLISGQLLLAGACVLVGVSVHLSLECLAPALRELNGDPFLTVSQLFPIPQGQLTLIGAATVAAIYVLLLGSKSSSVRNYITWDCGFGPLSTRAEETGSSFSHPIGRIFSGVLQLRTSTEITGRDRRHFPEAVKVNSFMTPILETKIYRPLVHMFTWLSESLVRLQTGSIHIHLLYVFLTMLLLVFLGTNL